MRPEASGLLEAARLAGAVEAELFSKRGRGRKIVLEPALRPGEPPIRTVSTWEEEGAALRVVDSGGRRGFAWIGLPPAERSGGPLLEAALASARHDPGAFASGTRPLGPDPRIVPDRPDLRLDDPESMALPAERIASLLLDAVADAAAGKSGAAVDRIALSEAETTVAIANSRGFRGRYTKSLAFLSLALIPEEPGAAPVVEERSACRLADLDARDCVREALRRAGPARTPLPAGEETAPWLLSPRASATLLAGVTPWLLSGETGIWKGCPLRIADDPTLPGRPGSAPFDGAGYETRKTILVENGALAGRLTEQGGNSIRPSYRDLPVIGPAGLLILPGGQDSGEEDANGPAGPDSLALRVAAIEIAPGPSWTLRLGRADWWRGGQAIGAADGLIWEGPIATVLRGATAAGSRLRFYHCGAPIGVPALRLDGLAPLRVGAPGRSAHRV